MNKYYFSFLLLFIVSQFYLSANAQIWQVITPDPDPLIIRVSVPDSMHIRGIGWYNPFHCSSDGGSSWNKYFLPYHNYNYIEFLDSNEGWLASDSGLLFHTLNGGQTFSPVQLPVNRSINEVHFQNPQQGQALVSGVNLDSIFITSNGGAAWTGYSLGTHSNQTHLYFISSSTGWMLKYNTFSKTIDGGISWTPQQLPAGVNASYDQNPISFIDSLHGWISGYDTLMYTNDGGNTWSSISSIGHGSIAFRDSLNGVCIMTNLISVTHDGGYTWTNLNIIDQSQYSLIMTGAAVSEGVFFIYEGGYVISSHDGDTWNKIAINSFPYSLSAYTSYMTPKLGFSSEGKGVFITGQAAAGTTVVNQTYVTKDSGRTWKDVDLWPCCTYFQTANDSLWYYSIYESSYHESSIYKSSNNFDTPGQIIGNFQAMVNCIYFIDSLHGVAGGDILKYTYDGGVNWFDAYFSMPLNDYISKISFVDSLNGWLCGNQFAARTSDGGIHWSTIFTNTILFTEIRKINFVDTLHGFFLMTTANDTTFMYKTSDGGINWSQVYPPNSCWDFHFNDSLHGWLATNHGLYYTDDGLNTFSLQDNHNMENISFYDHSHGYAASSGLLIHSDQTSVLNTISEGLENDEIILFPNPADKYFNIQLSYQSKKSQIKIFNILGRQVYNMNLENKKGMIDCSNFVPGIYFIHVFNAKDCIVKKIAVR